MNFPVYLKYSNDKNYFVIHSETKWEEYALVGKTYFHYIKEAKIFPDRMFILDLLENSYQNVERMDEQEFSLTLEQIKKNYKEKY